MVLILIVNQTGLVEILKVCRTFLRMCECVCVCGVCVLPETMDIVSEN